MSRDPYPLDGVSLLMTLNRKVFSYQARFSQPKKSPWSPHGTTKPPIVSSTSCPCTISTAP